MNLQPLNLQKPVGLIIPDGPAQNLIPYPFLLCPLSILCALCVSNLFLSPLTP